MCEMLSIVGKKLEENTKDKRRLEGYFVILEKWSKSKVSHQTLCQESECGRMGCGRFEGHPRDC